VYSYKTKTDPFMSAKSCPKS